MASNELVNPLEAQSIGRLNIPGPRKAAIICMLFGDEVASEIFQYLREDEVLLISRELANLDQISPEVAESIIAEFSFLFTAQNYIATGGLDCARRLLIKSMGPEQAKRILDKVTHSMEASVGFDALRKVNPQQLSKILQKEHPQTIAIVLTHLDASTAADTLGLLPESQRANLVMRMANLQTVSQDVVRRVSLVLDQKLKSMGDYNQQAIGGVRSVAELCNRLDRENARKMLEEIESNDPNLALSIRNLMVTFDDLLLVDDTGIREILVRIDKKLLPTALKGAIPEIQQRFFGNMSTRAADLLREEMDYLGQVKMKDVTAAQREVVNILRELDEQGIISITGGSDAYVS